MNTKVGAHMSQDGRYRWTLWRWWTGGTRPVCWVMLNPSTADATTNDPTIRKCMGFARRWGYDGIVVVNLMAWRTPHPWELGLAIRQHGRGLVIGAKSPLVVATEVLHSDCVAVAWGDAGGDRDVRDAVEVAAADMRARAPETRFQCLGVTKAGNPRHPLRLPYSTPLEPWP